ncbi:hypothetical protein A2U01_0041988, partial [Trifolium medium]|nr:hypothetical protein [Trifolium medium]
MSGCPLDYGGVESPRDGPIWTLDVRSSKAASVCLELVQN